MSAVNPKNKLVGCLRDGPENVNDLIIYPNKRIHRKKNFKRQLIKNPTVGLICPLSWLTDKPASSILLALGNGNCDCEYLTAQSLAYVKKVNWIKCCTSLSVTTECEKLKKRNFFC
jgi:hypothetical protein